MSILFDIWNELTFIILALGFTFFGALILFIAFHDRYKTRPYKVRVVDVVAHSERETGLSGEENEEADSNNNIGCLFAILGGFALIFCSIGVYQGYKYWDLTHNGVKADALVVENKRTLDDEGGVSYKAVVRFLDQNGAVQRQTDTVSYGSTPSYEVNARLVVFYDANDPARFVIDDFWHYMTMSLILLGVGGAVVLLILFLLYRQRSDDVLSHGNEQKKRFNNAAKKPYVFSAVVEYKNQDGASVTETTAWDSYSILDVMPGRRKVLYKSSNLEDSLRPKSLILFGFGLIIFCPGLYFGYMALKDGVGLYSVLALLGVVGFFAFKVRRFISKIPKDEWDKGWADLRKNGVSVTTKKISDRGRDRMVLTPQQIRTFAAKHLKTARIVMISFFVLSIGFGYGAYYKGVHTAEFLQNSLRAQGEVVNLNQRRSDDSYVYHAEVEFINQNGQVVRFSDSVGSSHPTFKRGDRVDVLYDPNNINDAIIDRGVFNWSLVIGLCVGALFSLLIAWSRLKVIRSIRTGGYSGRV